MAAIQPCVRCGAEAGRGALLGLCQKCLLEDARQPPAGGSSPAGPDRRFGDYELGAQLGRGGMGVVYQAVQLSLRRPVALKMILDSQISSPLARRRFHIEAEAVAKLDHPHIVPIYEVGEHEGQPFFSMKLIAGESLRQRITTGALCLKPRADSATRTEVRLRAVAVVRFVAAVARAVHHAHQHGVLHRDLKPGNILVDGDGQPHLTDFGLAKLLEPDGDGRPPESLTESGAVLGTPNYMSPEQADGQRLTAESDTYSLGAVFYEMLTGAPPFVAGTVRETLRLIVEQPPRRPSARNARIDKDLDTICLKCLEKHPAARYPSTAALADDLERWLRQEPIRARAAGVPLRVGRWVRRNRLGTALILCLFLGLTGALGLLNLAARRQARLDLIRSNNLHEFNQEIETLWQESGKPFVHIRSARLAEMAGSRLRAPSPGTVSLTLATVINLDPYGQAQQHAPVLALLEERMEELLGHPVLFDLRLYKYSRAGTQAPVTLGEVDFQRLGPLRYVQARQTLSELQLLVRETQDKQGVVFARKDAGVSNVAQVAGRRVAFADTNSTISFLTKVHLARAGVTASDLSRIGHLDVSASRATVALASNSQAARNDNNDPDVYPHREVLRRVLANEYDVGESARHHFELHKHRSAGLVELLAFPVPPDVIVARAGLDPRLVEAFRHSLSSLRSKRERTLLGRLKPGLEGYQPANDADFDELRSMLTNEFRRFESAAPRERAPARGAAAPSSR
jgi:ABC-type phosphate/phosphonate transport system substrate-binding protein/tRNA A-37 threonylcarbamoyl transferase component Bud32